MPDIVARHVQGRSARGAGRSTRLLKALGFQAIGVDVSESKLAEAQRRDPDGTYILVGDGDLDRLAGASFDLILSAFPLGNTAPLEKA